MSVDTVFQPKGPTVLVTNSAIQVVSTGTTNLTGMASFRIVNLAATTQRLGWAPTANASATGPAGAGVANQVYSVLLLPNSVETFEFPVTSFFIASTTTGFEMTPGQGA